MYLVGGEGASVVGVNISTSPAIIIAEEFCNLTHLWKSFYAKLTKRILTKNRTNFIGKSI